MSVTMANILNLKQLPIQAFPSSHELYHHLVGGFNHLEKYESQWEGLSHILWTNKKRSKPPTSISSCIGASTKSLGELCPQSVFHQDEYRTRGPGYLPVSVRLSMSGLADVLIFVRQSVIFIGFINYFTSSDPHHDISKQLVDSTFV